MGAPEKQKGNALTPPVPMRLACGHCSGACDVVGGPWEVSWGGEGGALARGLRRLRGPSCDFDFSEGAD